MVKNSRQRRIAEEQEGSSRRTRSSAAAAGAQLPTPNRPQTVAATPVATPTTPATTRRIIPRPGVSEPLRPAPSSRRPRLLQSREEEDEEEEDPNRGRRRASLPLPGRRLVVEAEAKVEEEKTEQQEETAEERACKQKRARYRTELAILPDWYDGQGPQCTRAGPPGFNEKAALAEIEKRGLPLFMTFGKYKGLALCTLRRMPDARNYINYFLTEAGFFDQFCDIDQNMLLLESLYHLSMLCYVCDRFNRWVPVVDVLRRHKAAIEEGGRRQRVGTGVMRTIGISC